MFVLNKVRDEASERYLRSQLERQGIIPVGVVPDRWAIEEAWLKGESIRNPGSGKALGAVVQDLERKERAFRGPATEPAVQRASAGTN